MAGINQSKTPSTQWIRISIGNLIDPLHDLRLQLDLNRLQACLKLFHRVGANDCGCDEVVLFAEGEPEPVPDLIIERIDATTF